jgi:ABC-type transporter MlaC component
VRGFDSDMSRKIYVSFIGVLLLLVSTLACAEELSARQVVEEFQNELLGVMKQGKELGFQGRYNKLDVAVKKSHDLPKIARIVVGKQWEELAPDQQTKLEAVSVNLVFPLTRIILRIFPESLSVLYLKKRRGAAGLLSILTF